MDAKAHWEKVYATRQPHEVSWFQREAVMSLAFIRRCLPQPEAAILDVGGGASRLVDGLLAAGYRDVTVLDLSLSALQQARLRLGSAARGVSWLEADILSAELPPASVDLWHDRAVFHFLATPADRARYVAQARRTIKPGGYLLIATFADDGPVRCSGLPVTRYSADALHEAMGQAFCLLESAREEHLTPAGATQAFVYCLCRLSPASAATADANP